MTRLTGEQGKHSLSGLASSAAALQRAAQGDAEGRPAELLGGEYDRDTGTDVIRRTLNAWGKKLNLASSPATSACRSTSSRSSSPEDRWRQTRSGTDEDPVPRQRRSGTSRSTGSGRRTSRSPSPWARVRRRSILPRCRSSRAARLGPVLSPCRRRRWSRRRNAPGGSNSTHKCPLSRGRGR